MLPSSLRGLALFLFFSVFSSTLLAETVQYFAQLAQGGGATTSFTIHNPGSQPVTVKLDLFRSDGSQITSLSTPVASKGTQNLSIGNPEDPLTTGWAKLSADSEFVCSELFQIKLGSVELPRVGVLASVASKTIKVFCFKGPTTNTGVALVNPGSTAASVTLRRLDCDGQLVETKQTTLDPLHHVAKFLNEDPFFSGLGDFQGCIEIESTVPVAAVSFRSDNDLLAAVAVSTPQSMGLSPGAVTTEYLADGAVTTPKIGSGAVTADKIPNAQVVKSLNGLKDHVILNAGSNVSIATGINNVLTISTTGSGGGSGDITGVTAGSGLTGGGSSGDVTLSVAQGGISASMIGSGQAVKSLNGLKDSVTLAAGSNVSISPSGNTLTISAVGGGGTTGDITSVSAGTGLTGGGTSGDVSLALQDGGVTNSKIADYAVTNLKIADNAISHETIEPGAVTSDKIAVGAVNSLHVASMMNFGLPGNWGQASVSNSTGTVVALMTGLAGCGALGVADASGAIRAGLSALTGAGKIEVLDSAGNLVCGLEGATGRVFGLLKTFRVPDPTDETRLIQYASIEGPEAAIYTRGTGRLQSGKAVIILPEHFTAMAAPDTLSVTLTPRSRQSLGLTTVSVFTDSFEVEELFSGMGTYDFDYVVYAVRKGFENYEVYTKRPAADALKAMSFSTGK